MSIWAQANRRGVFKMAGTYLVTCWLILEVGYVLTNVLSLPKPVMKGLFGVLVIGFPLFVALAWNFRLTGDGLIRHNAPHYPPADLSEAHAEGEHGGHGHGTTIAGIDPLPIIVGVMVLGALLLLAVIKGFGLDAPAKEATAVASAPAAIAAVVAPPNSIAVLPFENLSGDPGEAYFSDGMAEELRSGLASVPGLQVAARTSSNAFRGTNSDIATIAGKLGVAHTLEGSVRRAGDVVRVSATLVEAKTGFERWSQTYDRKANDIFAIQSEIAEQVTEALKVQLLPRDAARLATGATASVAAHDAYLRGRQLFDGAGDEAGFRAALAQFDAALVADPAYAAAHAARARSFVAIANQFDSAAAAQASYSEALAAARLALQYAPDLPEAQSAMGYVLQTATLDFKAASAAYDKSMVTGSGDADILIRYGLFNVRVGDLAKGLAALEKAAKLDRYNPRAWRSLGDSLYAARRPAEAVPAQREALRLNPGLAGGQFNLGNSLLALGKTEEARAAYAAEPQRWGQLTGLAIIEHRLGNRPAADAALKTLVAEFGDSAIYQQAQVLAQWGDVEDALAALNRALVVGDPGLVYLRRDPMLDPLRKAPGFRPLMARVSIE